MGNKTPPGRCFGDVRRPPGLWTGVVTVWPGVSVRTGAVQSLSQSHPRRRRRDHSAGPD